VGLSYATGGPTVPDCVVSKLVGAYEQDLHDALFELLDLEPKVIVNLGCAEGYYAIGAARVCQNSCVHAFDIDPGARQMCSRLAEANRVTDRVFIHGRATPGLLRKLPLDSAAVICDCEGDEFRLMDPCQVPDLRSSTILVELHEFVRTDMARVVTSRFLQTHNIWFISEHTRSLDEFPELSSFSTSDRERLLDENRPIRMRWALLRPRRPA
jgi:hypothetical protein